MFSSKKGSSRRRTILLTAGGVAVVVAVGVTVGVIVTQTGDDGPTNAASCSDVEFIGVAGSGQRDGGDSAEDQMDEEDIEDEDYGDSETPDVDVVAEVGDIVAVTYANLEADLPEDTSINLRAVEYPAMAVPVSLKQETWEDYFESVAEGVSATKDTINDTVDECPESKIVVAGYSQGAMALRRALLELGSVDSIVAGVLIGDGDKLPDDKVTTIDDYDTDDYEGIAQLARDQWDFDSGTSEEPLPSDWESRILSACRGGDVVCALESFDVGSITDDISAHTNYDAEDWREFLAEKVAAAS